MSEENTVASENQNDVATTTADTGTAPETTASETLLTASGNDGAESETSTVDESNDAQEEKAKEKDVAIPEKYEFADVEGVEIHDSVKEAFAGVAQEIGLSQEVAQSVLEKMGKAIVQANEMQLASLSETWVEQCKNDPEFGGNAFLENMGYVAKGVNMLLRPAGKELVKNPVYGNHPELVHAFYMAGKLLSADKIVTGNANGGSVGSGDKLKDIADSLFPNS